MEFHPIANAYPLLTGDAYRSFVEDIRARGVRIPIVIYEGQILDGRNRYLAAQETGQDCPHRDFNGTPDQAVAEVGSLNDQRRHLSLQVRAGISATLATLKWGSNQYAEKVESSEEGSTPMISADAARAANDVSRSSHERAAVILRHGTEEEKAALMNGTLTSLHTVAEDVRARTPGLAREWGRGRKLGETKKVKEAIVKRKKHGRERFKNALRTACQLCETAQELEVPFLEQEELRELVAALEEARGNIGRIISALRRDSK